MVTKGLKVKNILSAYLFLNKIPPTLLIYNENKLVIVAKNLSKIIFNFKITNIILQFQMFYSRIMGKKGQVEHEGIIKDISTNSVKVGFITQPSCIGCYAREICNLEQQNGDVIDIYCSDIKQFSVGEKVRIIIRESLGLKAVLIAYLLPFLLIMISLFVLIPIMKNEIKAGIVSLLLLIPYYLIIYLYRAKIKKEINFTLEKI